MRPTGIESGDRRRLAKSLAVTVFLYVLVFSLLALVPAFGSRLPGEIGVQYSSIRISLSSMVKETSPGFSPSAPLSDGPRPDDPRPEAAKSGSVNTDRNSDPFNSLNPGDSISAGLAARAGADPSGAPVFSGAGPAGATDFSGADPSGAPVFAGTVPAGASVFAGTVPAGASAGVTGSGSSGGSLSASPEFLSWLDAAIKKELKYPERARRRNVEGTVAVHVEIPADGSSCRASVEASSGSAALDRAAVELVESLFPSPVSPEKEFSGTLKIQYVLNRDAP